MARIRRQGVNSISESAERVEDVGDEGNEVLEEKGELVGGIDDSGGKLSPVDMDVDEKVGIVSGEEGREGLEGAQFGDGNGEGDKGLVLESKEGSDVESLVCGDKGREKDEILMEFEKRDELMGGEKEELVAQIGEEGAGGSETDRNVDSDPVEKKSVDVHEKVEQEAAGSVEVKTGGVDESVKEEDWNASTHGQVVTGDGIETESVDVEVGVKTDEDVLMPDRLQVTGGSEFSDNGDNLIDVAIDDLEPYATMDGSGSGDASVIPSGSKPEFQVSDLVWGKIRSHPWWPGQICDHSDASKLAMKYFKKRSYLIAYFWDRTFAWNDAPQIKPFTENFSHMEKQSGMEEFQNAVACALDEVSRRVEFGLACSCISKEVYGKLKTQMIDNAGVKEEASRKDDSHCSLSAASFEPLKLIKVAKKLAKLPFGRVDRLELVTSRAQLSSFYRWKGYAQLPEFNMLGGLLENDADISLLGEKEHCNEVREDAVPVTKDEELPKSKGRDISSHKRKDISGGSKQPSKKGKSLSNITAEKCFSASMSEIESEKKAEKILVYQSSSKKRKAIDAAMAVDSALKHCKSASSEGDEYNPPPSKQTFKVGDRIRRVASLLNGSSPIFKPSNATPVAAEVQDNSIEKIKSRKPQTEKLIEIDYSSPDEMLSHLCQAAMNPMKGYSLSNSLSSCFSKFRNTVCLEPPCPDEDQLPLGQIFGSKRGKKSTKSGKKSIKAGFTKKSESELLKDSYSSDSIVKCPSKNGELMPRAAASDKDTSAVESQLSLESNPDLDAGEDLDLEALKPAVDKENGELLPGAAPCNEDSSAVELQESLQLYPNLDSEQNIVGGDLELETPKPAFDEENGVLLPGASASDKDTSVVLQERILSNPNLDSEQNISGGGGDLDSAKVNPPPDDKNGALAPEVSLSDKDASAVESQSCDGVEVTPNVHLELIVPGGDCDLEEAVMPAISLTGSCEEESPAALILSFTNLESVPSEANLNNIFSCYGPLFESRTEVLKKTNRARVVFKRHCDAQKAFSSAGKYSTFGPALTSYRLKYPLTPTKATPSPTATS